MKIKKNYNNKKLFFDNKNYVTYLFKLAQRVFRTTEMLIL